MSKRKDLLLELVRRAPVHLTAEELFFEARKEMPGISLATVYNNLGALAHEGLIRRLHIDGQADRYDRTVADHQHLICRACGSIADLAIPDFGEELAARIGAPVASYELNIHYHCPNCRRANNI